MGLSENEVKVKLKEFGLNSIKSEKKISPIKIFLDQFKSPIILLLLFSAIISFIISYLSHENNYIDTILILGIVFVSSILGFLQEYKAEKTLESLKKLLANKAKVLRDGKWKIIDSKYLVPGDIISLSGGDIVPADSKIIKGNLKVNESMITGESKQVEKKENDLVFSGSVVYSGNAILKIEKTGKNTKLGEIAKIMEEIEDSSPFLERMRKFTNKIVFGSIFLILFIFIISYFKFGLIESMLLSISLAVAAIPENLPASLTINLSFGAKRMYDHNVLVRKLSSIETLGRVNVICSDKTGTITKGELEVVDIFTKSNNKQLIYNCALNCNSTKVIDNKYIGDETDVALFKWAKDQGKKYDVLFEIPFDSKREQHTVYLNNNLVFTKGAPEVIINKCNYFLNGNKKEVLCPKIKSDILKKVKEFSSKGYRVLAFAYKKESEYPVKENNFIFLSLICFEDPPREKVRETIEECKKAGIHIIMITGDNPDTALSIAKQVGIDTNGYLLGKDLEKMTETQIYNEIFNKGKKLFARVDPIHKLKILNSIKLKKENIVAMTGDGVNDALALKRSDIGIAMGIRGTDVAKQASDIILLDDSFNTIVEGIKQGKLIFSNMQKFINYLLSCNIGEVIVVGMSTIFYNNIILYPIQLLWMNFVTDGFPAIAISFNSTEKDILYEKQDKEILSKSLLMEILKFGSFLGIYLLFSYFVSLYFGFNPIEATTILLTLLVLTQFIRLLFVEKNIYSFIKNKFLLFSLILCILLHLIILYTPLNSLFKVIPLSIFDWIYVILLLLVFTFLSFLLMKTIKK